jgi:2Fe-2S ferredoxin
MWNLTRVRLCVFVGCFAAEFQDILRGYFSRASQAQKEDSMPKIKFVEHNGTEHVVDGAVGASLMRAAIDNLVPGIDADCGGECSCATCHVYVQDKWMDVVGQPNEREESMLDLNPERAPNSRLSCQIEVTDALEGLVVKVPEFQM